MIFPLIQSEPMNYRISGSLMRMIMGIIIFKGVFQDQGFYNQLCGQFAIPADPSFMLNIIIIQIVGAQYPPIIAILNKIWKNNFFLETLSQNYVFKNIIILLLKLTIIFGQAHRIKFYIHNMIIESTILVISFLIDLAANQNISEVWDIVITTSFHRIAILYQITRTFCPNFAIYWFIASLLQLSLSQIEAHNKTLPETLKLEPVYSTSLYVRQDVHRLMIMGIVYLGLFGLLQTHIYGYGMFFTFSFSFYPFYRGIKAFDENKIRESLFMLVIVCMCICGLILFRINFPTIFKPLGLSALIGQCANYQYLIAK